MSSTKKQNTKLLTAIAVVFAILIILGFITLLMISADNAPTSSGHEHAQTGQTITHTVESPELNA